MALPIPTPTGGIVAGLMWFTVIVGGFSIVATITWKYWNTIAYKLGIQNWPTKFIIIDMSAGLPVVRYDRARRLLNDETGMEKFELLNTGVETDAISKEKMYPNQGGEGFTLIVASEKRGQYTPLEINEDNEQLIAALKQKSFNEWGLWKIKQQINTWDNRNESFWTSKTAVWIGAGIFVFISLVVAAYYQSKVAEAMTAAAKQINKASYIVPVFLGKIRGGRS